MYSVIHSNILSFGVCVDWTTSLYTKLGGIAILFRIFGISPWYYKGLNIKMECLLDTTAVKKEVR